MNVPFPLAVLGFCPLPSGVFLVCMLRVDGWVGGERHGGLQTATWLEHHLQGFSIVFLLGCRGWESSRKSASKNDPPLPGAVIKESKFIDFSPIIFSFFPLSVFVFKERDMGGMGVFASVSFPLLLFFLFLFSFFVFCFCFLRKKKKQMNQPRNERTNKKVFFVIRVCVWVCACVVAGVLFCFWLPLNTELEKCSREKCC